MDVGPFFITNAESPELVKPADGSFHDPANAAQAGVFVGSPMWNARLDAFDSQKQSFHRRIVSLVRPQAAWKTTRLSASSRDGRNGLDQRLQLGHVVSVGRGDGGRQRNTLRIGDDMVLRAVFPAIRGAGPGVVPPKTARMELLSTMARERSIRSIRRNSDKSRWWIFSQVPLACHSCKRRQQVIPEPHSISCGKSCHGMPVLSTNTIPAKARRFSTGGRPPLREGGWFGTYSETGFHNSSLTNFLAIGLSSMTKHTPCHVG